MSSAFDGALVPPRGDMGTPPAGKIRVRARVENYYVEIADEVVTYPQADLDLPPAPMPAPGDDAPDVLDDWLQVDLFGLTGTGRTRGEATYELEITESSHPDLVPVGFTWEWGY